ncbi:TRAP transporter large permease [Eubacterium oxidoreducens]|uniref:TRAP transporter, DctM subunit n=1 Tax=Eubacterium oxidoreducens TaxID=1732 RepID=A0A1G6CJ87_EUBOX|nr:TRAP transporter large permease [Eubacterium oxidoreducens]SDB32916.1 TRAP transporter, DctM subunit [Eubacterium oxidoreducens]
MNTMMIALVVVLVILLISIAIGGPIATTLGFTACIVTLLFLTTGHLSFLGTTMYSNAISANNVIVPLFIMMAEFMAKGGIAEDLYYIMAKYLRKLKGGLAVATTLACTIFAALCGSSPATAATIGKVSLDAMKKRGYKEHFAIGTVAGGGTLGIMIPPSITLVMYGILTQTSILKLLMAGILPGLMLAGLMCASSIVRANLNPELIGQKKRVKGQPKETVEQIEYEKYDTTFFEDFKKTGPALILIVVIIGGMYSGLATATECAGLGAIAAFLIVLAKMKMTKKIFGDAMMSTVKSSSMMILMLSAALMLTNVIGRLGIASALAQLCTGFGINRWIVMILLIVLWYFLGTIMSPTAMVTLTIPFVFTPLMQLGFDPIWLGIVSTLCVEVGMITPPVGNNLFILKQTTGLDMGTIIKGALPQIMTLTIGLVILCVFPQIATVVPSMMAK